MRGPTSVRRFPPGMNVRDLIRQLLGYKPVIVYVVAGNVKRALGRVKGER